MKKIRIYKILSNNELANKILKNSGWLVSDKIFTMIIGLFVTAIVSRYFGPEQYGQFNYALSFVALFTALSTLGLETLTIKAIVDKDSDEGTILCTSLILRVVGGSFLLIIACVIIQIIEPNDSNLHILVLLNSFVMIFKALEVIEYWIQAHHKAKISSIIRMISYLITAGLKILLVLMNGDLIHYALIYIIDTLIIGFSLIIVYFKKREVRNSWNFKFSYAKNILSQSWYLILSGIMITLYMRIDQVMLGAMLSTTTEVGVYSAAVQIAAMWYFIPLAIITSFKPVIMSMKKNSDKQRYLSTVQMLYTIIAWVGIGFGLFISLFSDLIVMIIYGQEFIKASSILTISIWAGTFAMLGTARSIWIISEGLQKYILVYTATGFLVNLILNLLLIPIFEGYGAAIATLFAQFFANVLALAFFRETKISSIMILRSFSLKQLFRTIIILKNKSIKT